MRTRTRERVNTYQHLLFRQFDCTLVSHEMKRLTPRIVRRGNLPLRGQRNGGTPCDRLEGDSDLCDAAVQIGRLRNEVLRRIVKCGDDRTVSVEPALSKI